MRQLIKIFLTFARIGAFTFGGAYSMLPIFQREVVDKKGWIAETELIDYFSIAQCLPGIISVYTSNLIGHKLRGRLGGVVAGLGMVFPSVAIILVIAAFISRFSDIPVVQHAFAGIRVCVCVLIFNTIAKLWKSAVVDKTTLAISIAVFAVSVFTSFPAAILITAAGAVGIAAGQVRRRAK